MKKSRTFYNIFVPILLLSCALVVGFGSYIYISTIKSVVENVAENQQSLIVQVRNTMEQEIKTIEYAFSTYSTSQSFNKTMQSDMTENDFETYRELNSQLQYIATMGMEGVQYSLTSLTQNWNITNGSIYRLSEQENKQLREHYIDNQEESLFWIRTDTGIRFIHTLPVHSQYKNAIASSDIPLSSLNRMLRARPDTSVYIMNKHGELLFTTESDNTVLNAAQLVQINKQIEEMPETGEVILDKKGGSGKKVLYAKSAYNNWTYITKLDESKINDALRPTLIGLVVMGIVILLLLIIIAYFLSVYLARPFRKIQKRLPQRTEGATHDEVDWIIHSIDSIVHEKQQLEHLIEIEKPKLETQFILNLLFNRLTTEEIASSMKRFNYEITANTMFIVMLIQLDSFQEKYRMEKDVLLLTASKIVEEVIPLQYRMLPVVLNERTQATILLFEQVSSQEIHKQLIQYGKTIIRTTRDSYQFSVSIGISDIYSELEESKNAMNMGLEALHQRLHLGKESIIFFEDVSALVTGSRHIYYPVDLELKLFDAIRLGEVEKVSEHLYPLLAAMIKHSQSPANLEVMLMRFVNNLIQLEQVIGGTVLLSHSNANLFHRLLETRNPEEIERILVKEIIQPMVITMRDKTSEQFRSVADNIATIIRTEYDQDITLDSISDRLHYSPNYLSSIFKKEYNMTFSEYVTTYRLEVAKQWLVETDMTIKDIAEKLRYQNSQNFIRSFRKKEQTTPGAYRKAKTE
ncbi:AraC family transcriptional regulator [Paenibacillus yanchengensis]|uniref:AraC family transcriptional regulator n=1 Tax=Paenibacillus yanchengensis TaxID=2035833 RepID=A0ABW4YQJ9_9BACL